MHLLCPECEREQPGDARFCASCGTPLWADCPACGASQAATAAFCSACGVALRDGLRRGGSAMPDERRVVTVLFADLAGWTALGERLDPEDVRALQGELFVLVNTEVERHGGVTEKFVGDAVMAVFGIPSAHEDDPERAVRAALAMRDAFPAFAGRVQERFGVDIGIRLGVNTGEVVSGREAAARGELMVSGDTVNVAARLQQHAEPGTVLVGERAQMATRRAILYRTVPPLAARGKSAPLAAWVALATESEPLRRGGGSSAPLVGRHAELAVLTALADRVEREQTVQLVTLFGPAGIGKSRLVTELVARRAPRARVLEGRCLPYGDGITYWPLAEVAKAHAGILETDSGDVAAAKLRAAVASVVPAEHESSVVDAVSWTIGLALPGAPASTLTGGNVRQPLYAGWGRYVTALGREQPTILAIDDAHWASEPLLDLIEHLADSPHETAVLIVCPARPELLDHRPSWGAGKPNATALTLRPLGAAESQELMAGLLASPVDEQVRSRILDRADGNPFFLEEILRMLADQDALGRDDGNGVDEALPDSVQAVVAARIDLLEPPQRDALRRCAVMGRAFWPSAVQVDDELVDPLVRRGLVAERATSVVAGAREFVFNHSLTREVAYQTLPRAERRALHRAVGEWIQALSPDRQAETAELAGYHLAEAIAYGDDDETLRARAFDLLVAAGHAALARAAARSAVPLFRRAHELATGDRERATCDHGLGRSALANGEYESALVFLDRSSALAEAAGDTQLRADALGWKSRVCWLLGRRAEASDTTEEAIRALEGLPETPELARALARRSQLEMLAALPQAAQHAREALAVAQRVGDGFAAVNARINLVTAQANAGIAAWSGDELTELVDGALEAGAADEAYRAVVNYLWSMQAFMPLDLLEQTVERQTERLRTVVAPEIFDRYLDVSLASLVLVPTARWDEACRVAGQETFITPSEIVRLEVLSGIALRRGDLEAAGDLLDELERAAVASREAQRIVPMASIAAPFALVTGDGERLRRVLEAVVALSDRQWAPTFHGGAVVRAAAAAGENELLGRLCTQLRAARERGERGLVDAVLPLAEAHLALAAGRAADAIASLEQAISVERALRAPYRVACLETDLARALAAAGRSQEAAAATSRAAAVLEPLGCVNAY